MRGFTDVLRRGATPVFLTSLCVLGLAAAALAAPDRTPPAVVLIQPGHWTVDRDQRAALHVHGGTEQVDALVALPDVAAREALSVVQGESEGFVVGRDRAWTFAKSTLVVGPEVPLPASDEEPVGIEAPGGPYLVYRNRGTIVRLGAPQAIVKAGGPLGPPVRTGDGTVWVHRPDDGTLCAFRRNTTDLDCRLTAGAGSAGGLTVVADAATFVDTRDDTARQVRGAALAPGTALGADVPDEGLLADQATPTRLPVVVPGPASLRLLDATGIPTDRDGGVPIDVPLGPGTFSAPFVSGDIVAVLELTGSTLLTFDSLGTRKAELRLPPGTTAANLRRGQDGRLYVDENGGARVHAVRADGTIASVDLRPSGGVDLVARAAPESLRDPVAPPPPGQVVVPVPVPAPGDVDGEGPVVAAPGPGTLPGPGGVPGPEAGAPGPGTLPDPGGPRPGGPENPSPPPGSSAPPPVPVPVPAQPVNVTATLGAPGEVTITWTAGVGGGPARSYTVTSSGGGTATATARRAVFSGLAAGEAFSFTVTATNATGTSAPSDPSNTVIVPAGKPPAPLNLAAARNRGTDTAGVNLTWDAPSPGEWQITGYRISTGGSTETVSGTTTTYFDATHYCSPRVTYRVIAVGRFERPDGQVETAESDAASMNLSTPVDCTYDVEVAIAEYSAGSDRDYIVVFAHCRSSSDNLYQQTEMSVLFDGVVQETRPCPERSDQDFPDDQNNFLIEDFEPGTTYQVVVRNTSPSGSKTSETYTVTTDP